MYLVLISCCHSLRQGHHVVHTPTKDGFRVYLVFDKTAYPSKMEDWGWQIMWIATDNTPTSSSVGYANWTSLGSPVDSDKKPIEPGTKVTSGLMMQVDTNARFAAYWQQLKTASTAGSSSGSTGRTANPSQSHSRCKSLNNT